MGEVDLDDMGTVVKTATEIGNRLGDKVVKRLPYRFLDRCVDKYLRPNCFRKNSYVPNTDTSPA